jgi:hypothetical protein
MSTYYPAHPTCRFCGERGVETKFVKYNVRHYAHFACYLAAGKPLDKLHKWQVESFPWKLIKERGLEIEFDRVIREKQAQEERIEAWQAAKRVRDIAEGIE